MGVKNLDELDQRIIYELQMDARHTSANDIAEKCDVSPSTIRKLIQKLEDSDIIQGYHPEVSYKSAGYQLQTLIIGTAPIPEREQLAKEALEIEGIIAVREVMTGQENLHIEVIGNDDDDLSRIGRDLDALGITIEDEDLIRNEYESPYNNFKTIIHD
jgi:DNA-binding Lrp family transcriptional regulator